MAVCWPKSGHPPGLQSSSRPQIKVTREFCASVMVPTFAHSSPPHTRTETHLASHTAGQPRLPSSPVALEDHDLDPGTLGNWSRFLFGSHSLLRERLLAGTRPYRQETREHLCSVRPQVQQQAAEAQIRYLTLHFPSYDLRIRIPQSSRVRAHGGKMKYVNFPDGKILQKCSLPPGTRRALGHGLHECHLHEDAPLPPRQGI